MLVLIGRNDVGRQLLYCSSKTMDKAVRMVKIHCFVDKGCNNVAEFDQSQCRTGITLGTNNEQG